MSRMARLVSTMTLKQVQNAKGLLVDTYHANHSSDAKEKKVLSERVCEKVSNEVVYVDLQGKLKFAE